MSNPKLTPRQLSEMSPIERLRYQCDFPDGNGGCWLFQGAKTPSGYGQFWWKGKNNRAHRVSYQLVYGDVANGVVIRHTCDTPNCVNPLHLVEGTQLENMADMKERQRSRTGESNWKSILTNEQVLEIYRSYHHGISSVAELSLKYDVAQRTIYHVVNGSRWGSLTGSIK